MKLIPMTLVSFALIFGLSFPASADDGPTISFSITADGLGVDSEVTASIEGLQPGALQDNNTIIMLERAARLAIFTSCVLVYDNISKCHEKHLE